MDLRAQLEPLFVKYGVDVVFAGHEHFYERIKPQKGIYYFTQRRVGASCARATSASAADGARFDTDNDRSCWPK